MMMTPLEHCRKALVLCFSNAQSTHCSMMAHICLQVSRANHTTPLGVSLTTSNSTGIGSEIHVYRMSTGLSEQPSFIASHRIFMNATKVHAIRALLPCEQARSPPRKYLAVFGGKQVCVIRYQATGTTPLEIDIDIIWRLPERVDWVSDVLITSRTLPHVQYPPSAQHQEHFSLLLVTAHNRVEAWHYPSMTQLCEPIQSSNNSILYAWHLSHREGSRCWC
jgi:hypothetical protein